MGTEGERIGQRTDRPVGLKYIDWHRTNIYLAASPLPRTIVDPMWLGG
jgi:hypothetical protein